MQKASEGRDAITQSYESARLASPVGERDHYLGLQSAPVTLLMYGDYECPHTRRARPAVQRLLEDLGEDLRYVFRNFPLTNIHPHAQNAAEAAEAAAAGGRFWEMHEKLFANQKQLGAADLVRYAEELGLGRTRLARDLTEHTCAGRVLRDYESGLQSGVRGTPAFFVNGLSHEGAYDYQTLLYVLERALET